MGRPKKNRLTHSVTLSNNRRMLPTFPTGAPSKVGEVVIDPDTGIVVGRVGWDGAYRAPGSWGHSRGLLMVDEGGVVFG